jgi:hypothetical protein
MSVPPAHPSSSFDTTPRCSSWRQVPLATSLCVVGLLWCGCSGGGEAARDMPATSAGTGTTGSGGQAAGAGAGAPAAGSGAAAGEPARASGDPSAVGAAGMPAAGMAGDVAGAAGAPAAGMGAAGGSGESGQPAQPSSAGAAGTQDPGTSTTGRACHSAEEWTPASGDIWISPSGSDVSEGSEANPKQTLTAALSAWSAGKTIWVMPGTYAYTSAIDLAMIATEAGPLRISGIASGAMPVFDFSGEPRSSGNGGQRGFEISGSFVHLRYLEVEKAADNCVYVTGQDNTVEWLRVHECQDTGVQLSNGAANNKVLNVDSYLNADPGGENADGFAPKLMIGQGNYFCGTRAYHNADDGYDCWASGDGSPVKFEYCWAFGQPGPTATANGDGNGFKLGSPTSRASGGNAAHELIDCYAFHNRSVGFTANGNNSGEITCTGCGEWGNGAAWSSGSGGREPQHTGDVTNLSVSVDRAIDAARDAQGNLPDISTL